MKDKLRELAERWKKEPHRGDYQRAVHACADDLIYHLDAEDDGGVPLPGVVWNERTEAAHLIKRGTEVEFCAEYGCCRVFTHPARSGVVSDEDDVGILRQAEIDWNDGIDTDASQGELMRLCNAGFLEAEQFRITKKGREAIDAAIQGERHGGR